MPPLSDFVVSRGKNAWQKHGQAQYGLQNYTEALDAFTKAIQLGQGDYIDILDNRAATYCALERLEPALRDGRRMIKSEKKDARGYLRTAKVLQLMKKMEEALQLYDYALNILDSGSEGCKKIRVLRTKLDRAINGQKLIDPFKSLPPELISEVLWYLDLRILLRIIRVSKLWLRLGVALTKGWSHLDLTIARRNVTITAIRAYLHRSRKFLTHATLANVKPDIMPKIVDLLSRCRNLTHLDVKVDLNTKEQFVPLNKLTQLTALIMQPSFCIQSHHLIDILCRCRRLERVEAHGHRFNSHGDEAEIPTLPNIRSLTLGAYPFRRCQPLECLYGDHAVEKLPNLEELCQVIGNDGNGFQRSPTVSGFANLSRYELIGARFETLPEWPKTLEHLRLTEVDILQLMPMEHYMGMEKLKTAVFDGMNEFTGESLRGLLTDAKSSLTSLEIGWTSLDSDGLKDSMRAGLFENITHLNICGIYGVNDPLMSAIVDHMPSLKVLDISNTEVTPLGVKLLADTDRLELRKLFVHNMSTPMSRDIVDYARNRGIIVPAPQAPKVTRGSKFRFSEL